MPEEIEYLREKGLGGKDRVQDMTAFTGKDLGGEKGVLVASVLVCVIRGKVCD